jgi:hypothetical protein
MAKKKRVGSGERFVVLHHWLLKSPAWRAFSPNGKAILLHIWERHNGANNGEIVYAVREAKKIGLSKSPAARALKEAIDLGFLRITRNASFTLKTKEARSYALTAEPINGRTATKEFMKWTPAEFKTQSPQRDRQPLKRPLHSPPRGTLLIYHPMESARRSSAMLPGLPHRPHAGTPTPPLPDRHPPNRG